MVSAQAKSMAGLGYPVVLFDLFGTGDSGGQFEEATWETWINDLRFVCEWSQDHFNSNELTFWGLRAGCLLAKDFLQHEANAVSRVLFWQPIISGERVIAQLRRLDQLSSHEKQSDLLQPGSSKSGIYAEIAGYKLNADLIQQMSLVALEDWHIPCGVELDWLEISALEGHTLGAASERLLNTLQESSPNVIRTVVVMGQPFWFTQEVAMVPALLEETLKLLNGSPGVNTSGDS